VRRDNAGTPDAHTYIDARLLSLAKRVRSILNYGNASAHESSSIADQHADVVNMLASRAMHSPWLYVLVIIRVKMQSAPRAIKHILIELAIKWPRFLDHKCKCSIRCQLPFPTCGLFTPQVGYSAQPLKSLHLCELSASFTFCTVVKWPNAPNWAWLAHAGHSLAK
jgi:hypothetical protein